MAMPSTSDTLKRCMSQHSWKSSGRGRNRWIWNVEVPLVPVAPPRAQRENGKVGRAIIPKTGLKGNKAILKGSGLCALQFTSVLIDTLYFVRAFELTSVKLLNNVSIIEFSAIYLYV